MKAGRQKRLSYAGVFTSLAGIGFLLMCLRILGLFVSFSGIARSIRPETLRAPQMEVLVLDGQTREPVAGACVQVSAEVEKTHFYHGTDTQLIHIFSAVTDAKGHFISPAWGPIKIPSGWYVDSFSPDIMVEKEGYDSHHYGSGGDRDGPGWTGAITLKAQWNRCSILLYKDGVRHSNNEYAELLEWDGLR